MVFAHAAHNGTGRLPRIGRAPAGVEEHRGIVVDNTFDRARLETDDDDSGFPPAEPASISPRPSRPSTDLESGFFAAKQLSLAPAFPTLPAPPARVVSPERLAFAKRLFVALFGCIAVLLGYALLRHAG